MLSALLLLVSILSWSESGRALNADSLHWAAWDYALAGAQEIPALRYSYYAYRTLAVPHPEIYLRADALFSEIVENIPGSRAAYRGANVRDIDLYRRLQRGEQGGPAFSWRMWVATPDSIYDYGDGERPPSWLDRRLPSAAVILCALSPRLTTAEAAMMRYTQMRRSGQAETDLFVIIDTAGHGYVALDTLIIVAASGRNWDGDTKTIAPALVFNERSVYYPLFARDDRTSDSVLSRLLEHLGSTSTIPMSATERERVEKIRSAAALPTERARQLAVIAAIGGVGIDDTRLRQAWHAYFGSSDTIPVGCEQGMVRTVMYWANRLSRPLARLAALPPTRQFDSAASVWQEEYLTLCGRRVNPKDTADIRLEAGGNLWSYELLEIPFDDIIRTRTGQPSSQALAMAAVLDLAGFPNIRLEVSTGHATRPDQHWVIADGGRWQFNLGNWNRVPDTLTPSLRFPLLLRSYGIKGRWAGFNNGLTFSDADNLTIAGDLTQLATAMPLAAFRFPFNTESLTPMVKVMRQLTDDKILWRPLRWPEVDEAEIHGDTGFR